MDRQNGYRERKRSRRMTGSGCSRPGAYPARARRGRARSRPRAEGIVLMMDHSPMNNHSRRLSQRSSSSSITSACIDDGRIVAANQVGFLPHVPVIQTQTGKKRIPVRKLSRR